jgi:hypothetical protein
MLIELPFVLISGMLGSAHCLGMCGPFALAIGAGAPNWRRNLLRQTCYTAGRVFTYAFLGACAGYAGAALGESAAGWVRVPAVLAIVAGLFLIYQGLATAGAMPVWQGWSKSRHLAGSGPCLTATFFASFLRHPRTHGVFLAGLFTGFLPCGLVYAFLALAASSASVAMGAATMVAFGFGTAPVMIATGWGGSLLGWTWRRRLLQVAAWCVVAAGVISLVRGAGYLQGNCPFCP